MIKHMKLTYLFTVLLIFSASLVYAQEGVTLSVRLHEQQIYFPDDAIAVRVTIHNESSEPYRFRLAANRNQNLDFDMRTGSGSSVPPSTEFTTALGSAQTVFYREVDLLPGEEFSFIEELNDYREIESGLFYVHARFFPELRNVQDQLILSSNTLTVSVREGFRQAEQTAIRLEELRREEMQLQDLSPDRVVAYTIEARMESEEEKFFQYLDLERLYQDEDQRAARYDRLSAVRRREVLQAYREEIWERNLQEGISLIPMNYRIQNTQYGPFHGTVTAELRFDQQEYIEIKRFTYELELKDGIWFIVRYTVINLGTEARN